MSEEAERDKEPVLGLALDGMWALFVGQAFCVIKMVAAKMLARVVRLAGKSRAWSAD